LLAVLSPNPSLKERGAIDGYCTDITGGKIKNKKSRTISYPALLILLASLCSGNAIAKQLFHS